jgi:Mn-containing catalase
VHCQLQGWDNRGPEWHRGMLIKLHTKEIGAIKMLSTAMALNLEAAPLSMQDDVACEGIARQ